MKKDKIICNCFDISQAKIEEAIDAGAKTVDEITDATYAGGGCKRCRRLIQEILDKRLKGK